MNRASVQSLLGDAASSLEPESVAALADWLAQTYSSATAAWPGVALTQDELARGLAERIPADASDRPSALARLHATDLFLALAAARHDEAALRHLESRYLSELPRTLRSLGDAAFIEEAAQRVRERLLVTAEDATAPRIAAYDASGPLGGFIHVTAVRVALNLREAWGRGTPLDESTALANGARDLELDYLKARHRDDFRQAFESALAQMDARERTLLRLQIVDGLSIDAIGAMYAVHRATAARWLVSAREQLVEQTRAALRTNLRVSETELHSILGLIESQVDVSVVRLLSDSAPTPR